MNYKIGEFEKTSNIVFKTNENWLLKIEQDGTIKFNDNVKLNADEFAKEFISIVENHTYTKANEIFKIINSDEYKDTTYKRFAKEDDRDYVKARLFDKICILFN